MVGTSSNPSSLKEYLKKYTSNESNDPKDKKKKKKRKAKPEAAGVVVVDEDPVWQKPVNLDDDDEDSADEEKPQVDEDIDVKRMRRLEQIRSKRPFGVISEDGSGWISVSDNPNNANSENQISDISPPRKRKPRNDTPSPEPETKASHFPGGRTARHDTPSPERHLKESSPPRRHQRNKRASSPVPGRTTSHSKSALDTDISPPRRSSDISPPRKRRPRNDTPSPEVERKASHFPSGRTARHDTPSPERNLRDLSPPRRQQRNKQASSLDPGGTSVPSKAATDSDISPPRRAARHDTKSNYQDISRDLSPPRKSKNDRSSSIASSRKFNNLDDHNSDLSPPRKRRTETPISSNHPKTGLVSGVDIKDEIDRKRKEELLRFKEMDPSVSGQGAEATYRDKLTGERMSKEDFLKAREKRLKKDEKPKEVKLEWGKGLAQKKEAEARLQEMEAEKEKPFARSRDDPELDAMLKERVRWGDPMAHLAKKKQFEPILPDLGDSERMKESGFIIPQEIPTHSWIRRGLNPAPNRYGIKPGRHWDGVDRSTGYENELFKRTNEKKATETEAYLWSVSDM